MLNEKKAVAALNHIKRIEKRLRTRNDKMARWNTDENKTSKLQVSLRTNKTFLSSLLRS